MSTYIAHIKNAVKASHGSQVSQILALTSANRLDHYIKETLRIRGYGRDMDDGYLIHHSKEYLQQYLKAITKICELLHIQLNTKSTQHKQDLTVLLIVFCVQFLEK